LATKNKRRGYRVDDVMPMLDTPLSTEEFHEKKTQIGTRARQSGMMGNMTGGELSLGFGFEDHLGNDIGKALQMIDQKLNYLISTQMLNDANRLHLQEQSVNLSITGMNFLSENHYREGDGVEITLMLPSFPPLLMELLAEVKRIKPGKKGQHIGVDFVFRSEDEERNISHHVLKRQREMIRLAAQKAES